MDVKFYVFFVVAALGAVAWVFVGRSGHTAGVPVPTSELMLRRFLENTMYARPREKEFIIGHPALMLYYLCILTQMAFSDSFLINSSWCYWYCFYGRNVLPSQNACIHVYHAWL